MGGLPAAILVAGAINTDLVATMDHAPRAGETINGERFAVHGGGKAANQAVAVARSGGQAHLLGAVGEDDFGRARLTDLTRDRVAIDHVRIERGVTSGVALIFVETGGENRIACVPGASVAVSPGDAVRAFGAVAPALVMATNELAHETIAALFDAAHLAGTPVLFNAAPEPETGRDLLGRVTTLIVNEVEAAALLDEAAEGLDGPAAVRRLLDLGIATVVLTAGAKGAWAGDAAGIAHFAPPSVRVVDTTGAGDTFCGAFASELASGATTRTAAAYAVAASALSVTREGAQSSIPTRDEVQAVMKAH